MSKFDEFPVFFPVSREFSGERLAQDCPLHHSSNNPNRAPTGTTKGRAGVVEQAGVGFSGTFAKCAGIPVMEICSVFVTKIQ
jgi:hypothetical protein